MSDVIKFCDKTINKVYEEPVKAKTGLNTKLNSDERNAIFLPVENNDELNKKHLQ